MIARNIILALTMSPSLIHAFMPSVRGGISGLQNWEAVRQKQATTGLEMSMIQVDEDPISRGTFLQEGVLVAGALGVLGQSQPAAAGLLSNAEDDKLVVENVSKRMMIAKSQKVKWSSVSPVILKMREEVRERFAKTGAKGGREVSSFLNVTSEGANIFVGIEVADPTGSPALGEGFGVTEIVPPGAFLSEECSRPPSVFAWIKFVSGVSKEGYELRQPLSLFEVYAGTGGPTEARTIYASINEPAK